MGCSDESQGGGEGSAEGWRSGTMCFSGVQAPTPPGKVLFPDNALYQFSLPFCIGLALEGGKIVP